MRKKNAPKSNPKIASKTKSSKTTAGKKDFFVVGLGASAGGIKALREFFSTMPADSGMAFVVILRLSPDYESSLAEILQSQTTMPVKVVEDAELVKPDNVYVIPPNRQLEMMDGIVRCTGLSDEYGECVAIDMFFRMLADECRKNAVCVVLSGTGSDGTLGLKTVKEANGFAIVQSPADAEHDSMPRSAIATQLADWILPVREMPDKLIQFRDSSQRLHLTDDDGDIEDGNKIAREIQADDALREVLTVLRIRTGHDFSNYKTPTLIRRIARHLQIHNLDDVPSYLELLRENPEEIHSLLKNLLINVTNFFRDKNAWTALEREIVPNLFAGKKAGDTLRIWSCGRASGEEAYSLAMILNEHVERMSDAPKIQVFATDVDEDAISEARGHRYPQSIEADVSAERLQKFFVKEGRYYSIKKELREMVLFAPHNVLRDPPFSRLDLILCRNLLIYFNRDSQERVMEIFHFALAPNGYLFLGSSETAETTPQFFTPVDKKLRIYRRRAVMPANYRSALPMPVAGRPEVKLPEYKPKTRDRAAIFGELHHKLLEKVAPPSVLISQNFDIEYMSDSAGRFLHMRGGAPSNNLLKLINPDLLPDLRAALFSAQRDRQTSQFENIRTFIDGEELTVNLIVRTVETENESGDYLLVIFDENKNIVLPPNIDEKIAPRPTVRDNAMEAVVEELERTKFNLRATIEQHEVSVEELKASNEELQAINEELRSTTEELETSKEELQSVNEELTTVNHELKEKMDETSRTNSDLQNLMASTDIATIFLDRSFRIKRYTPPVEQIFNVTPLDIGRPLEHFTHRLDYKNLVEDTAEVLRNLSPIEREICDNENRTYLTRFVPYRTIDDRIEGVIVNFVNITERKEAEEKLRKSEEHLNLILESAKDYAIITYDLKGRIVRWNKGAEKIFGWKEKEAVGETTHLIFTPEDIKRKVPEKEMANTLKNSRAEDERWHIRKDGSRFFASGVMQLLRDGKTEGFVKICRDQTERLQAETALREREMMAQLVKTQEEERRRIAREIHDHFGQQLTVLRLKLDRIKKQCTDEEICDDIELLQEISERLDREADFLAWELRPVALDDLGLRAALENFVEEWARHTGITADFHAVGLARTRLSFEFETNLYRIAQEALNNVYKHSKTKNVSILLEKRGSEVLLIIEDEGVGFNVRDGKKQSKGIGLAGMRERAKLCHGTLEIESKSGKGTTVFVRIPFKKD